MEITTGDSSEGERRKEREYPVKKRRSAWEFGTITNSSSSLDNM